MNSSGTERRKPEWFSRWSLHHCSSTDQKYTGLSRRCPFLGEPKFSKHSVRYKTNPAGTTARLRRRRTTAITAQCTSTLEGEHWRGKYTFFDSLFCFSDEPKQKSPFAIFNMGSLARESAGKGKGLIRSFTWQLVKGQRKVLEKQGKHKNLESNRTNAGKM